MSPAGELEGPSRAALGSRAGAWLAFAVVTAFGLALLWPVPAGRMPMSADHPVHLARIWSTAEQLAHGRLAGWSSTWFFGFPVGELYPQLGDLIVIGVHTVGVGLLDWWQSYALGFTLVFLLQGWALLRAGRAFGLGPAPGSIAGLLVLADPGMYREGGWTYTVGYGVWPQALATTLAWWGLAELAMAWRTNTSRPDARALARAGLVLGAALLAHPMTLPMLAMAAPLLVLCLGLRGGGVRIRLAGTAVAFALAFALAAGWLVPMLAHREWMANYGWLFVSLESMTRSAIRGEWTGGMPPAVGLVASAGLLWAAFAGRGFSRFVAALALCSWLFAARDVWWWLRLDRWSEGFGHLQYQRFLLSAKPGLYLIAGAVVTALARGVHELARRTPASEALARARALGVGAGALVVVASIGWMTLDSRRAMSEHHVGEVQLERKPDQPELAADFEAFTAWARQQREQSTQFDRIAWQAERNAHWFMDAPLLTGSPMYKIGFTPGDNFVHKPESRQGELLDRLRVRWLVHPRRGAGDDATAFGKIAVDERPLVLGVATIDGGRVEVLEDAPDQGRVRVRVTQAQPGARLVFNVAGFPRWRVTRDGEPVEWVEVPALGTGPHATVDDRRRGRFRGGKADGDDGTEPTLIAVLDAGDGEYSLEYRYRLWFDWAASLCSLFAGCLCVSALASTRAIGSGARRLVDRVFDAFHRAAHPLVLAGLGLLFSITLGVRWTGAAAEESRFATGWLIDDRARDIEGMRAAPFKTDMLIRSAVIVRPRRTAPATATFAGVELGPQLRGWIAIDDDAAKARARGKHRIVIEGRVDGAPAWEPLLERAVKHRPGRVALALPTGPLAGHTADLRVRVLSSGQAPPPFAFDLELEPGASAP